MQPTFFAPDAAARRRLLIGGVSATACALLSPLAHAQDNTRRARLSLSFRGVRGAALTSWRGVSGNW